MDWRHQWPGIWRLWILVGRGRADYRRHASRLERIAALSLPEATVEARALLADPELFRLSAVPPGNATDLDQLAPELRGLFQQYDSIEILKGAGALLQRSVIGPAEHGKGFTRIGKVAEATDVEGEVAVKPGAETVYVLHPGEPPDPVFGMHRSVYHWLIAAAEEQKG
jgi:hypothetical protein